MSATAGNVYDLTISTLRFGATTTVEDSFSTSQSAGSLSAVTGRFNGVVNASLCLSAFGGRLAAATTTSSTRTAC